MFQSIYNKGFDVFLLSEVPREMTRRRECELNSIRSGKGGGPFLASSSTPYGVAALSVALRNLQLYKEKKKKEKGGVCSQRL